MNLKLKALAGRLAGGTLLFFAIKGLITSTIIVLGAYYGFKGCG